MKGYVDKHDINSFIIDIIDYTNRREFAQYKGVSGGRRLPI